jgi:hypothetical protein
VPDPAPSWETGDDPANPVDAAELDAALARLLARVAEEDQDRRRRLLLDGEHLDAPGRRAEGARGEDSHGSEASRVPARREK